jgi:hypothetical protein
MPYAPNWSNRNRRRKRKKNTDYNISAESGAPIIMKENDFLSAKGAVLRKVSREEIGEKTHSLAPYISGPNSRRLLPMGYARKRV